MSMHLLLTGHTLRAPIVENTSVAIRDYLSSKPEWKRHYGDSRITKMTLNDFC
jgi:hypothetical protein